MSDVKDELKNVLEDKKRFTDANVERVFQKIDEKQRGKKVYWKPMFAVFTILAALLTLLVLLPKQQETSVQEIPEQLEEKLVKNFEEYTNNRGDEILYSEMGFGEENWALIISHARNGQNHLATIHEFSNNEWHVIWNQALNADRLYITDTPRIIYAGSILGEDVSHVAIGGKEVKTIKVNDITSVFVTIHDVKTDSVIYHSTYYPRFGRLFTKNEDVFLGNLNLVNREGDEFFYEVQEDDAMNFHHLEHPIELVVDPSFELINQYDVVLVDDGTNSPYLSRVAALPNNRFKVEKGTIIINDEPQHTPYGSAKVDGKYSYEEYVENHTLSKKETEALREIFTMNVPETQIPQNEYMLVSDNWKKGEMKLVKREHIKGVVKGDSIQQLANEWTKEEIQLYHQMETQKDKQLLKNLEPQTVARLYYYASFLGDEEMLIYFLSPTAKTTDVIDKTDIGKKVAYNKAKDFREGTFVKEGEIARFVFEGAIYKDFKLIKNRNGYWEMSFD